MNIEDKALTFAINAHQGQVRKSEDDKPMIIHPVSVAHLLKEYGFDSNVISAGYLHDVVEDTKYTQQDIMNDFGEDISSLVASASEPDKSLSWEERKQHTIDTIKKEDLRHKAIVCADKINNLEDMRILFGKKGTKDFSSFKRGFDKQKWYYENVYESLIYHEDKNNPMFMRLKEVIDDFFGNKSASLDNFFIDNETYYHDLTRLYYKNEENKKLYALISSKPYVIEFTGTPRTGKTSIINNLYDFFNKSGYRVKVIEEFTTSKKYKEDIKPLLANKYVEIVNTEIPRYILSELNDELKKDVDIIIVDRCLFDRLIWVDRLYQKDGMKTSSYENYKKQYIPLIKDKINMIIGTYTDSLTALKRDYMSHLSLEHRSFLNEDNVNTYNKAFNNMRKLASNEGINLCYLDTTVDSMQQVSVKACEAILDDMRKCYLKIVKDNFN